MNFEFLNVNVKNRDLFVKNWAKKVSDKATVLDIGAGTGPYRSLFSGCKYITHDKMPLDKNQLRGNTNYTQIDIVSDITSIPLENDSIDAIICTEVLEHVPYPIDAINEMMRILKPGGKLLITVPLGSGIHQPPYHFYGGFTPFFFKEVLNSQMDFIEINPNGNTYTFFYQEFLRFSKLNLNSKFFFILFPFSIVSIFMAFMIRFFDRLKLYKDNFDFCVGYHVTAIKK
jgi:ubiquinone/menaquinone biosynthesis C-methylase UbiE